MTTFFSVQNDTPAVSDLRAWSETQLIAAAKSGRRAFFGELWERHRKQIFCVTRWITLNPEDAEDAAQDCFLSAFVHLKDFDGRACFASWLTRIAINAALMKLRKNPGSQSPGMLHNLPNLPAVRRTLDDISGALQSDVRDLDSEQNLDSDVSVQVALFAAGVSTALALMDQGIRPAAVSGVSVGSFAAAVAAGVLGLRDGLELVRLRAKEMIKLYPNGYGLSAIVGLTESQVTRIVEATTSSAAPVFVANIDAPRQIVIAGADVAMDQALEEARRQGASMAVRLHVSLPSHCPLLQPVADLLARQISIMSLRLPQLTYVGNVGGRALRTKELVADDLANNIAHGVRWHDATTVLKELGCNLFLEMPPGHVLSGLANGNLSGVNSIPVDRARLPRVLRLAQEEEQVNA